MAAEAQTAFLSYSREDFEFALRLAEDLKAAGARVWMDQVDITPGQHFDTAIEDALTQSPRMLLILSPASVKSRNVRDEITFALDAQKTIIPVLYRDCIVPLQLRRVQHIDFRSDYDHGLNALLKTLGVEQPPERTVPAPPPRAESYQDGIGVAREKVIHRLRPRSSFLSPKLALALCGILIVGLVSYWAFSRPPSGSEQPAGSQKQQAQAETSHPRPTEQVAEPVTPNGKATNGGGTTNGMQQKQTAPAATSNPKPVTPQLVWAVGDHGAILHTEDGGGTWRKQTSDTSKTLLSVVFTTPQSGWAVGYGGTILHTDDGGGTWTQTSTRECLYSAAFATPQSGWAVGSIGTMLLTKDGGATWERRNWAPLANLKSVAFATPQSGWVVGDDGIIMHTEDGGGTWETQRSGTSAQLWSVAFATPQSGWAVGGTEGLDKNRPDTSIILHTENGGGIWKPQTSGTSTKLFSVAFTTPR